MNPSGSVTDGAVHTPGAIGLWQGSNRSAVLVFHRTLQQSSQT